MDNQNNLPSQQPVSQMTPSNKPNKRKIVGFVLASLVLVVAGCAGTYFWQKSQNNQTLSKLDSANAKIKSLEAQLANNSESKDSQANKADATAPDSTNPGLIPGDTDTRRDDGRILISGLYKYSLEPTAVWIEYGTSPTKLNNSTDKSTRELGLGDGEYGEVSPPINNSDLQSGTTYYYRVAATINGQTERSGLASFITDK